MQGSVGTEQLRRWASLALSGVGSAKLGEWEERRRRALHIRRRVSVKEERIIGPVVDVRGTREGRQRLADIRAVVHSLPEMQR